MIIVRSFILIVLAASLAALAAGCSGGNGGGSKKPSIRSFEASPATLPLSGGVVTLTWDVKHADALFLEPGPGLVTGTGATITVTGPTSFLLTARNSKGDDLAVATVSVAAPITVSGTVAQLSGSRMPNIPVFVHGHEPVLTADDGTFSVPGVSPPYDVSVVHPFSTTATSYLGLTVPNPNLLMLTNTAEFSATSIDGTLSPGFPSAVGVSNRVCSRIAGGGGLTLAADETTGNFSLTSLSWDGNSDTTASIAAFLYNAPDDGLPPTSFISYGSRTTPLENGNAPVVAQNITLAPISGITLAGTYSLPADFTFSSVNASIEFAPLAGCSFPFSSNDTGSFSLIAPSVPSTTARVDVSASSAGASIQATRRGLTATTTGIDLTLTEPPLLIVPVPNSNGVSLDTNFTWTPYPDGLFVLLVIGGAPGQPNFVVFTDQTHAKVPDLSVIGLGLPPDADYAWALLSLRPFVDLQELVTTGSILPPGDLYEQATPNARPFHTAP